MPSYRYFCLKDGRRGVGEWVEASDDDEALKLVRELGRDSKCEVWLQQRLVGITLDESSAAPPVLK